MQVLAFAALCACTSVGPTDTARSHRRSRASVPTRACRARKAADPDRADRRGQGLAGGREAHAGAPSRGERVRQRPRASALALRAAERRCARRGDQCARTPEDGKGIKGKVMKTMMAKAGAAVPSANRITLLRDADGDGVAETRSRVPREPNSPFGMALIGNDLYVANTDAIVKFPYTTGATQIAAAGNAASPICPAARSIITGPRTSSRAATAPSSTRPWARTATSPRTASTRKKAAPRSGKST